MLALLWSVVASCGPAAEPQGPVAVVVTAGDAALSAHVDYVSAVLQKSTAQRFPVIPQGAVNAALTAESGAEMRSQTLEDARTALEQARLRFRDLDPQGALEHLARATPRLVRIQQHPEAPKLLSRVQLLAGAIYLAMGRRGASHQRLHRALDLDPSISARELGAAGLAAEVAAVRAARDRQPTGRLALRFSGTSPGQSHVWIDGRRRGKMPFDDFAIAARRHLIRVSAPGYRSYVASIEIPARGHKVLQVRLQKDAEQIALTQLAAASVLTRSSTRTLALLARRTGAQTVVWADLRGARRVTSAGTATVGFELTAWPGGAARAESIAVEALTSALDAALSCAVLPPDSSSAPPLASLTTRTALTPYESPPSWWKRPGFFAGVAAAVLGGVALAVSLRGGRGEPTNAEIILVPRP